MAIEFDKKVFAERLGECVAGSGDKDYRLAEYLHLSNGTISKYKAGEMAPKMTAIIAIAEKYGVRHQWLMGIDDEKYPKIDSTYMVVPVLGRIAAGKPINVEEDILGYESVPTALRIDFALQVHGDSMIGARIYDKDIIFFRKQDMVETGEIAAVQIDKQEYTLKRVYYDQRSIELRADNPMYTPIVYTGTDRKEVCALYNL